MKKILMTLTIIIAFTPVLFGGYLYATSAGPPNIDGETAILMDQKSGKILYAKNAAKQMYPASTTKILTALVAVELGDLDEIITVGNEVLHIPIDSSKAGLSVGDTISLRELIYGLMLPSGNDAAYTIAVHLGRNHLGDPQLSVSKAVAAFADLMNQRAQELGALATNFTVPDGYHDAEHYTSAHDLALISRAALEDPFLKDVVATHRHVPKTWIGPHARAWPNGNYLVNPRNRYYYEYATGLKSGYIGEAGFCMVSSAAHDNMELIAVIMNTTREGRWLDSTALLEYGFTNFTWQQLVETDQVISTAQISGQDVHQPEYIEVVAAQGFGSVFARTDIHRIDRTVNIFKTPIPQNLGAVEAGGMQRVRAPLEKGQVLGEIIFSLAGKELYKTELIAAESVSAMPWWRKILVPGILSMGLGFITLFTLQLRRRKRRRRFIFRGSTGRIGL